MNYFSRNVTRNIRQTALIGFLITGILAIIGSFLLEKRITSDEQLKEEK